MGLFLCFLGFLPKKHVFSCLKRIERHLEHIETRVLK